MLEPKDEIKIFVYGSLRTGFFNYNQYLLGNVSKSELGKVNGKLYHMPYKGYPALVEGDNTIYGEVMTLNNFETVMNEMDEMENYFGVNNPNNEYNRIIMNVELECGKTEKCYVYYYAMNDEEIFKKNSIYISNGDWAMYMLKRTS